jgi:hypothetical protein
MGSTQTTNSDTLRGALTVPTTHYGGVVSLSPEPSPAWSDLTRPPPSAAPPMSTSAMDDVPLMPTPAPVRSGRAHLGDLLVGLGGLMILAFSFAPFVSYDPRLMKITNAENTDFQVWFSAWSTQMFMAPITWWVVFAGVLLVAVAAARFVADRDLTLSGFTATQLELAFGLFAFLVLLGYALADKQYVFGQELSPRFLNLTIEPHFAWGGVAMLAGSIVALMGALLNHISSGLVVMVGVRPR